MPTSPQLLSLQALAACQAQLAAAIASEREDRLEAAIAQARALGVSSTAAALRLEALVEQRLSLTRQKHEARELRRAQLLLELDAMVAFSLFLFLFFCPRRLNAWVVGWLVKVADPVKLAAPVALLESVRVAAGSGVDVAPAVAVIRAHVAGEVFLVVFLFVCLFVFLFCFFCFFVIFLRLLFVNLLTDNEWHNAD